PSGRLRGNNSLCCMASREHRRTGPDIAGLLQDCRRARSAVMRLGAAPNVSLAANVAKHAAVLAGSSTPVLRRRIRPGHDDPLRDQFHLTAERAESSDLWGDLEQPQRYALSGRPSAYPQRVPAARGLL